MLQHVGRNDLHNETGNIDSELKAAKRFARTLKFAEVKSGEWFTNLLTDVVRAYERNVTASYFQQKYPGLPPDDLANKLIDIAARYASIVGAGFGAAATGSQLSVFSSAGATLAFFGTTLGAEVIYLTRLQMRLVLDLAVVYDLQLDSDDPEDVMRVFRYAVGVLPTGMMGRGLGVVSAAGARTAIRTHISKGTLKSIQQIGRRVGVKILQRTIIKYMVPVVSVGVGSTYNYFSTLSIGRIAKADFKSRFKVSEEIREFTSGPNIYDITFLAALLHMAQVDGEFSPAEDALYRAMLSRMTFDSHSTSELKTLLSNEENILHAVSQIRDGEMKESLLSLLIMMATCDGRSIEQKLVFLEKVAERLQVELDRALIAERIKAEPAAQGNIPQKTIGTLGNLASGFGGIVSQTASNVHISAKDVSLKIVRKVRRRRFSEENNP